MLSSLVTLMAFAAAAVLYVGAPPGAVRDIGSFAFWGLTVLWLAGAIAGTLRSVALSTTVTLLVPEDRRDRANGLVGTANGLAFAITSVFSGLAVAFVGMGGSLAIAVVITALVVAHLLTIRIDEAAPTPHADASRVIDIGGAIRAI